MALRVLIVEIKNRLQELKTEIDNGTITKATIQNEIDSYLQNQDLQDIITNILKKFIGKDKKTVFSWRSILFVSS